MFSGPNSIGGVLRCDAQKKFPFSQGVNLGGFGLLRNGAKSIFEMMAQARVRSCWRGLDLQRRSFHFKLCVDLTQTIAGQWLLQLHTIATSLTPPPGLQKTQQRELVSQTVIETQPRWRKRRHLSSNMGMHIGCHPSTATERNL